jgi:hypothetical protein
MCFLAAPKATGGRLIEASVLPWTGKRAEVKRESDTFSIVSVNA